MCDHSNIKLNPDGVITCNLCSVELGSGLVTFGVTHFAVPPPIHEGEYECPRCGGWNKLPSTNGERDGQSLEAISRRTHDRNSSGAGDHRPIEAGEGVAVEGNQRAHQRAEQGIRPLEEIGGAATERHSSDPVAAPAITEGEEDAAEFYERQREELLMDPPLPEPIAGDYERNVLLAANELFAEPIAAEEECTCEDKAFPGGPHWADRHCKKHAPIAAGEEDDRPGLGSSATPDRTAFPPIAAGGVEKPLERYFASEAERRRWYKAKGMNPDPTPSSSDLVERLRKANGRYPDTLWLAAADTIQRLEAELDAFKVEISQTRAINAKRSADLAALQSERDRLREALERTVKFNDVRIARAALAGGKDG
jgi:hypothetical protein